MLFDILFWHGMIHFPRRWRILPWCLMDWQSVAQDWLRTRGKKLILKDGINGSRSWCNLRKRGIWFYTMNTVPSICSSKQTKDMFKHFNSFAKSMTCSFCISCALMSHFGHISVKSVPFIDKKPRSNSRLEFCFSRARPSKYQDQVHGMQHIVQWYITGWAS